MTAIIGYADGEHVWIGADSRAMFGWDIATLHGRKVFRTGDLLIGGSGILYHVQLLRLRFQSPERPAGVSDEYYMSVNVADAIRKCLADADTALDKVEDGATTSLLIGYRGVLYDMSPNGCLRSAIEQVYWLGAGGDLAAGAFLALKDAMGVVDAMHTAFSIAARYNATVGAPFHVECL